MRTRWIAGGTLFAAYVLTARFGLGWFDAVSDVATTVWPPSGLAIAALVLFGPRLWPAIALAALAVNFDRLPPSLGAVVAAGNTLEAVACAALLRRFAVDPGLARVQDVVTFVPVAIASCAVAAVVGTAATVLARPDTDASLVFATWLIGDVLGALVVAPVVLTWRMLPKGGRIAEALALLVVLAFASSIVFLGVLPVPEAFHEIYVLFPLLIWAAMRFGPRGAATSTLLVSAFAIAGTASGQGPYARTTENESLLLVQAFMGVVAVTMLILAAAAEERRRAVDLREEFLAIASHELKTPITALKIRLQIARTATAEMVTRAAIDVAIAQVDRISRLVGHLLDLARIGRQLSLSLEPEPLDLGLLTGTIAERHREDLTRAGSALTLALADGVTGRWDALRLEQVLVNLLSNALRHAPGAPVAVSVSSEGGKARLVVRDAGPGIQPSDRERIFKRYERVSHDGSPGLGLGLHIAREIVVAHGGEIRVEDAPGGGAAFVVELPL